MTPAVPPVPAQPAVPAPMTADAPPAPAPSAPGQPVAAMPQPGAPQQTVPQQPVLQPGIPQTVPQQPGIPQSEQTPMMPPAPEPGQAPASRPRRFSLRARLIALVMAVAAVALIAVDVVIPITTRSALISTKDQTLASVIAAIRVLPNRQVLLPTSEANPLAGEIGWSVVGRTSGAASVRVHPPGYVDANPVIGPNPPEIQPATVPDAANSATYRILAQGNLQDEFGHDISLVAWVPLSDVDHTIDRLILLEILVSAGLLMLLAVSAGLAVRREMRPLEAMARAADDIAAGDLGRRVVPGATGTEVGRLGTAFNGMVDSVSDLLAERSASEDRMRQFVADASHELRTPVAAIRGYTDLFRAGALPDDASVQRAMERMGFESRRMGALVEDLLTLIHADADAVDRTGTVDLVPLLSGVVDDAAVIDPTRNWRLDALAESALVRGDRLRLHQIFANLLGNVRTHTPAGTAATVYVTAQEGVAQVSVMDNGPGVDLESLPRLFDRFYRVDKARSREQGGSGLGLSIVAAIARMHRGRVWAAPSPGGGLTITVQLPLASADPAPDPVVTDAADEGGAAPRPGNGQ